MPDVLSADPTLEGYVKALPGGSQSFWGVPFELRPGRAKDRYAWVGEEGHDLVEGDLDGHCTYLLLAYFALPPVPPSDGHPDWRVGAQQEEVGEHLADASLVFADGSQHDVAIRRHFEIGDVIGTELAFSARPSEEVRPLDWRGPHADGRWGLDQQSVMGIEQKTFSPYDRAHTFLPLYWIHALSNPRPEEALAGFRLRSVNGLVALAAATASDGAAHPLRHRRLETLRVRRSRGQAAAAEVSVDLGIVASRRPAPAFDPTRWLADPETGWGSDPAGAAELEDTLLVDVAASPVATVLVDGEAVDFGRILQEGSATGSRGGVTVELLTPKRRWVSFEVVDEASERPTAARVHFRAADGRYLPPYGHRRDVNDRWFEDHGADLQLGGTPYAYVDGRFEIELPIGTTYVEVVKGFEYEPLRSSIQVEPGTASLKLPLKRAIDARGAGWVSADTHVHFLSPQSARLEAQAEGVDIVNLLASQWGELFTNVPEVGYRTEPDGEDETIVWVGSENRQHMLGHLSLLGLERLVAPMCAGGPPESQVGDPVWSSLSEWADACRSQGGITVLPHFTAPHVEAVADVVLGKVDGVEIRDFGWGVDTHAVREWYRLLNSGCRVAAVGGTDKMSAGMPLGGVRTYAWIGQEPSTYDAWKEAVRAGRTCTSSGPLIDLTVEGRHIGDSIMMAAGGGTLSVEATALSTQPLSALEIVVNGRPVERVESNAEGTSLRLASRIHIDRGGWIAARCWGPTVLWHLWPVQTAAHTSPVYVTGLPPTETSAQDRRYLMTVLDGGLAWLETLATRVSDERHDRIRTVFLEARRRLAAGVGA